MDVALRRAERYAQVHIVMAMASLLSRVRPSAIQQILCLLRLEPDQADLMRLNRRSMMFTEWL
jgi:hypothetical protein